MAVSRPEDIPRDVWIEAQRAFGDWRTTPAALGLDTIQPFIARSILSERERCAEVARRDNTPAYGPHRADMEALAEIQRENIAAAILRGDA